MTVTANSRQACLHNVPLNLPQEAVLIDGRVHVPAMLVELTLSAARRMLVPKSLVPLVMEALLHAHTAR